MNIIFQDNLIIKFGASNCNEILTIDTKNLQKILRHNDKWAIGFNEYGNINNISCRSKFHGMKISLPRLVLSCCFSKLDFDVNHINRDRRINTEENLELICHQDNCRKDTRELKFWNESRQAFRVKIRTDHGRRYIGQFKTHEEALEAYYAARLKYNGF